MGTHVIEGRCGDIDLSGIKAIAILDWFGPIHEGNGRAVFVVPPAVSDEQLGCMAQIFTGRLGGMPWAILGTTYEVAGVVRTEVEIDDDGMNSGFRAEGVGEAKGTSFKNPVTGEEHLAAIVLDTVFIWSRGDCGQGSFHVKAEGITLDFTDSNWISYDFDWTNAE